jgi:hypothetical protein
MARSFGCSRAKKPRAATLDHADFTAATIVEGVERQLLERKAASVETADHADIVVRDSHATSWTGGSSIALRQCPQLLGPQSDWWEKVQTSWQNLVKPDVSSDNTSLNVQAISW